MFQYVSVRSKQKETVHKLYYWPNIVSESTKKKKKKMDETYSLLSSSKNIFFFFRGVR
jgi:hypothetical protein